MTNFCPNCGFPLSPTMRFCENCGAKLIAAEEPAVPQGVQPAVPPVEPTAQPVEPTAQQADRFDDGYVIPDLPETPTYPGTAGNPSGYTAGQASAPNPYPQNPAQPAPNPYAQNPANTAPVPPGGNQNPYVQNTGYNAPPNAGQNAYTQNNAGPTVPPVQPNPIPFNKNTGKKSGMNFLPIVIAAAAVVVFAVFALTRGRKPSPQAVPTPEPTAEPTEAPFVIHTPDIQIPTAGTETPAPSNTGGSTDIPQDSTGFLHYGIPCDSVLGRSYQYPGCYDGAENETAFGTLVFEEYSSYLVTPNIIDFGNENNMDLEGYKVCELESVITFTESDASERGVVVTRYTGDFYDIGLLEATLDSFTDSYDEECYFYEVDNHGKRQKVYFYIESDWIDDDGKVEYSEEATFLIPADYDGVVRGFIKPSIEDVTTDHADSDVFLYRLNLGE